MDVVDDPTTIRLTVKKKDSETNTSVAQGNASLAGAQYKVTYVNGIKTVENIVTTICCASCVEETSLPSMHSV